MIDTIVDYRSEYAVQVALVAFGFAEFAELVVVVVVAAAAAAAVVVAVAVAVVVAAAVAVVVAVVAAAELRSFFVFVVKVAGHAFVVVEDEVAYSCVV